MTWSVTQAQTHKNSCCNSCFSLSPLQMPNPNLGKITLYPPYHGRTMSAINTLKFTSLISHCIGCMDKLAPNSDLNTSQNLFALLTQSLENPPHLVQKLGWVAELIFVRPILGRRPRKSSSIQTSLCIIIILKISCPY